MNINKKKLKTYAVIFILGVSYYIFTQITGWYIPCPIYKTTGLVCPGCGISHFITDMLAFRPIDAIKQNYAVAVLIPVFIIAFICLLFVKEQARKEKIKNTVAWIALIILIIFAVLRNIPAFSFLMPLYMR